MKRAIQSKGSIFDNNYIENVAWWTLPIDDSLIESDDDEEQTSDPLENFLAALGLNDYWDLFKKEKMDIEGVNWEGRNTNIDF